MLFQHHTPPSVEPSYGPEDPFLGYWNLTRPVHQRTFAERAHNTGQTGSISRFGLQDKSIIRGPMTFSLIGWGSLWLRGNSPLDPSPWYSDCLPSVGLAGEYFDKRGYLTSEVLEQELRYWQWNLQQLRWRCGYP